MSALLSILALYNYDNTIFDNMVLPEDVDKDDVVNNLLLELAELEIIYPNFDVLKMAIGFWSKKELPIWNKLVETTKLDYNPIQNFTRTEEYVDTQTRNLSGANNETRNLTGSDNETRNLLAEGAHKSKTTGDTTNKGTDVQKEYVSGFNENTPTLAKQVEQVLGAGNTVVGEVDTNKTDKDTGTVNKTLTDIGTVNRELSDTGTIKNEHTAHFSGNIGVVSTQKLIEAERKIVQFNIVNHIIDSFKARFCILIY